MNLRILLAAAAIVMTAAPAVAAYSASAPVIPAAYRCFGAPAKVAYDKKHDRFIIRYAAERLVMLRAALANVSERYVNRKKNLEWRLENGQGTFSSLLPASDTVDKKLATCVYKR